VIADVEEDGLFLKGPARGVATLDDGGKRQVENLVLPFAFARRE
jgi:hypothetical protein